MSSATNFSWPFVDPPPAPRRPKRPWESSPGTSRAEAARDWQRRVRLHAQREAEAAAAAAAAAVWAAAAADETVSICEPLGAAEERPAAETVSLGEQLEAAGLTAEEVASVLEQLTADEFAAIMALETGSEMPPSAPARDSIDRADTVLPRARLPPRGSRKRPLATEGPLRATWQRYPGNHPPPLPPRPPPTPQQSAELEASNRSLCEVAMELAARRLHELAASVAMPHHPQAPPLLHQPAPPSPPLSPPSLPRPHACSSTPTSTATTSSSRTARVTGL